VTRPGGGRARRATVALLLAVLVVLAGCGGGAGTVSPTDTDAATDTDPGTSAGETATPGGETTTSDARTETAGRGTATAGGDTATPDESVTVDGELPADVDPELVYERVQRLTGIEASSDVTIEVRDPEDGEGAFRLPEDSFLSFVGVEPPEGTGSAAGVTTSGSTIALYTNGSWSALRTELVLAHEFTHALQFQTDAFRPAYEAAEAGNRRLTVGATVEGTASYVHRAYVERYFGRSVRYLRAFNESTPFGKWAYGPYWLGARYVETRIDDPRRLSGVLDDPPRTTEQVLHGYGPDEERPRPLSVEGSAGDGWDVDRPQVTGELVVNVVLSTELGDDRAWRAAAGWGADRLVRFSGDGTGFAWVLRWDSPAEATEFREALQRFLDARGDRSGDRWRGPDHAYRVETVGEETVVLLVGPDSFLDAAAVDGTAGDVSVAVGTRADAAASGRPVPPVPPVLAGCSTGSEPRDAPTGPGSPRDSRTGDRSYSRDASSSSAVSRASSSTSASASRSAAPS
jgi:hypothetical protein